VIAGTGLAREPQPEAIWKPLERTPAMRTRVSSWCVPDVHLREADIGAAADDEPNPRDISDFETVYREKPWCNRLRVVQIGEIGVL
jgi:hypothetical protein